MSEESALKIVVIDDSQFSRKATIEILTDEGYEVVGEANGAEAAMNLIGTSNADLYIIDVVMPEVSGIELAKIISEKSVGVYIVMMSSLSNENIIIESISSGALDFLQKPFDRAELLSSVRKINAMKNESGF
ncbi:MAG: response regulator [Bacteriovoracaceae bacterium]|nr:response regulator [Bacteriovoracaceae bacterium]